MFNKIPTAAETAEEELHVKIDSLTEDAPSMDSIIAVCLHTHTHTHTRARARSTMQISHFGHADLREKRLFC
jgi:hypothetical protein